MTGFYVRFGVCHETIARSKATVGRKFKERHDYKVSSYKSRFRFVKDAIQNVRLEMHIARMRREEREEIKCE